MLKLSFKKEMDLIEISNGFDRDLKWIWSRSQMDLHNSPKQICSCCLSYLLPLFMFLFCQMKNFQENLFTLSSMASPFCKNWSIILISKCLRWRKGELCEEEVQSQLTPMKEKVEKVEKEKGWPWRWARQDSAEWKEIWFWAAGLTRTRVTNSLGKSYSGLPTSRQSWGRQYKGLPVPKILPWSFLWRAGVERNWVF